MIHFIPSVITREVDDKYFVDLNLTICCGTDKEMKDRIVDLLFRKGVSNKVMQLIAKEEEELKSV